MTEGNKPGMTEWRSFLFAQTFVTLKGIEFTLMEQYYRHFRNQKIYRFVAYATIEATGEEAVVYQAMYGDRRYWIRPKANFFEEVLYEGKMVPRFQLVETA